MEEYGNNSDNNFGIKHAFTMNDEKLSLRL